jgi:hypothetical protein
MEADPSGRCYRTSSVREHSPVRCRPRGEGAAFRYPAGAAQPGQPGHGPLKGGETQPCLSRPERVPVWLGCRGAGRALRHGQFPVTDSMMVEAYFAGSSSQTKCPASMITRRLAGSRCSRNSALRSGTILTWRPLMMVTGTMICDLRFLP